MLRIIVDSSSEYSNEELIEKNIKLVPIMITIDKKSILKEKI